MTEEAVSPESQVPTEPSVSPEAAASAVEAASKPSTETTATAETKTTSPSGKVGSVLVVGGGISGMQSSLDLADSGFKVYLLDTFHSMVAIGLQHLIGYLAL